MQPHRTRRTASPLSQFQSVSDEPASSHPSYSVQHDPRSRAMNEGEIDDLSGLYHQNESRRTSGLQASAPLQHPHMSVEDSNRPSNQHSHPLQSAGPQNQRHSPSQHSPLAPHEFSQYRPYPHPHSHNANLQPSLHSTTPPPRGSSLPGQQIARHRPYTYVRGQESPEEYEGRSWHDPDYGIEEDYRYDSGDLEKAFPGSQSGHYHGNGAQAAYAYAGRGNNGQPLIHYVTNEWKTRPVKRGPYVHNHRYESTEIDETCCEDCEEFCQSRLCRRFACVLILAVVFLVYSWTHWIVPDMGEKARLKASVREALQHERAYFGVHQQMVFPGTKQYNELDRAKVPGSGVRQDEQATRTGQRRLIIIGDIHGCISELKALLTKVSFNPESDHLVSTGDMVSRGPESLQVVSFMASHNASCVRGNHEDRVLLAHRDLKAPSHRKSTAEGITAEQPIKKGAQSDLELAGELDDGQLKFLADCSLVLDGGHVPGLGHLVITHAGLVPFLPLPEQDPFSVMNMRTLDLRSFIPSRYGPPPNPYDENGQATGFTPDRKDEDRDRTGKSYGVAWTALWDVAQALSPSAERMTVVYGHDEMAGLTRGDWHYGLDGGCVAGGKLAALVVSGDWRGRSDVKKEVVTVDCKQYVGVRPEVPTLGGS